MIRAVKNYLATLTEQFGSGLEPLLVHAVESRDAGVPLRAWPRASSRFIGC